VLISSNLGYVFGFSVLGLKVSSFVETTIGT
jgi:hypothetical protein